MALQQAEAQLRAVAQERAVLQEQFQLIQEAFEEERAHRARLRAKLSVKLKAKTDEVEAQARELRALQLSLDAQKQRADAGAADATATKLAHQHAELLRAELDSTRARHTAEMASQADREAAMPGKGSRDHFCQANCRAGASQIAGSAAHTTAQQAVAPAFSSASAAATCSTVPVLVVHVFSRQHPQAPDRFLVTCLAMSTCLPTCMPQELEAQVQRLAAGGGVAGMEQKAAARLQQARLDRLEADLAA
ncbi:hypothetical protein HaLaN_32708, partial [Haematococcus lacustris]